MSKSNRKQFSTYKVYYLENGTSFKASSIEDATRYAAKVESKLIEVEKAMKDIDSYIIKFLDKFESFVENILEPFIILLGILVMLRILIGLII